MKSRIWIALLVIIGLGGIWLVYMQGSTKLELHSASLQSAGSSLSSNFVGPRLQPGEPGPEELKVYRWKDQDRTWSLANRPPPPGTDHEVIDYTPQ